MAIAWNINQMSDNLLTTLHSGIANAKAADEAAIQAGRESIHGTETYGDFKEHADALEVEMQRRGISHVPISW
jgi:hypothetical protein